MAASATSILRGGRIRQMGQVTADVTVSNVFDEARVEDGDLVPSAVRSIELRQVMVDTGANMLCSPSEAIARLGLRKLREVTPRASGRRTSTAGPASR